MPSPALVRSKFYPQYEFDPRVKFCELLIFRVRFRDVMVHLRQTTDFVARRCGMHGRPARAARRAAKPENAGR
jgi:hypothetical protein